MQSVADELPRVTVSMLRRADEMCRRRLHLEHQPQKSRANRSADARFAVSGRIAGDARLAQAEHGLPRAEAFVDPIELEPEQRRLYRASVRGYLGAFRSAPGRVVDLGWATEFADLGVVLVANIGLPVELDAGVREVRVLQLGARGRGRPMLDPVTVNVALLRTEAWAPDRLRIVAVDLIDQHDSEYDAHLPDDRDAAREWLAQRVAVVRARADKQAPRAGVDCLGCRFVAGCSAHPVR
jgi:hypothetical protein